MNLTDPIADLLTRIRNAAQAGLKYTVIPASRMKIDIIRVMEEEGFVRGFRLIRDSGQGKIKVAIKYTEKGASAIRGLRRVSKPSCRVYKGTDELPHVRGGLGVALVSTSKGIMTCGTARKERVGGEVLAYIW